MDSNGKVIDESKFSKAEGVDPSRSWEKLVSLNNQMMINPDKYNLIKKLSYEINDELERIYALPFTKLTEAQIREYLNGKVALLGLGFTPKYHVNIDIEKHLMNVSTSDQLTSAVFELLQI